MNYELPSGAILKVHPDYTPKAECDGCGSGWNEPLVPDNIYGLDIKPACCPHDFRYELGDTQEDKDIGDTLIYWKIYLHNLHLNGITYTSRSFGGDAKLCV